jgi:hypothetical protein
MSRFDGEIPPRRVAPIKRTFGTRCVGCGKPGKYLCAWCSELQRVTLERVAKLWSTVENRFAARRA